MGALALLGIAEHDLLRDLLGIGDDPPRLVFELDRPVERVTLDATARLIQDRLRGTEAGVKVEGDRVIVETDIANALEVQLAIDPAQHRSRGLALRIVDYSPDYLPLLKAHLRETSVGTLHITTGVDLVGTYLDVPNDAQYVNPAWAERHHCTGDRIVGTGVYCTVSARDRIAALLHGDEALFVPPLEPALAVPADRELVEDRHGLDSHFYVVERAPIVLAPAMIAGMTATKQFVTVALTEAGVAALAPRTMSATELAIVSGDRLVIVQRVDGKLLLPIDPMQAQEMIYAFGIHALHALMRVE